MSRNLVKQIFAVEAEEARVIDTNELIRRRMESAPVRVAAPDSDGFVSGLDAEEVEVPQDGEEIPGSVIKASEDVSALIEQARADAEVILENAKAEADRIVTAAKSQAENDKISIMESARQQGYSEGQSKAMAEVEAARREFQEQVRRLEEEYQQQIDELEPRFVDVITAAYEHIFRVELSSDREILMHLIYNTMRRVEGGHTYLIHVSKEDYTYVEEQKQQLISGVVSGSDTVDVLEDITLGKNECMIETDTGIFDCGLGTQLAELKQKLMLLAWSGEE